MIFKNKKCYLAFNPSYSEICCIAQLRAAILALSILWEKEKKGPCQEGEMEDLTPTYTTSKE
jgi:hypothetical protein